MADSTAVIMAGGAGTRFWPLSTDQKPKQFLHLLGERSLLQQSYDRLQGLFACERILVFTHQDYLPLVREQLPQLPVENLIGEPMRRDTAAVNALAALVVRERFGDCPMAVLTCDHVITPTDSFQSAIRQALDVARSSDCLCTLGIRPAWPATEYGYLKLGSSLPNPGLPLHRVAQFREKPDLSTAQAYLESGQYLWNSGMFFWSSRVILEQYLRYLPSHLAELEPVAATPQGRALSEAFARLKRVSVDYAILEHAEDVRCLTPDFSWSDLGGWLALSPYLSEDEHGNQARGRCAAFAAQGNLVFCEDDNELVALVGVRDLIVVRSGARTLVLPKTSGELVKKLLEAHGGTL